MKKIFFVFVALVFGAMMSFAQNETAVPSVTNDGLATDQLSAETDTLSAEVQKKNKRTRFYVSAQCAAALSMNENWRAFFIENQGGQLVKPMPSISFGWDIVPRFGVRLTGEWSRNTSACNYEQEQIVELKFRPYNFDNFAIFGDFVLHGGKVNDPKPFNWSFFAGIGYAYSYNFTEPAKGATHEYALSQPNSCFAFRYGFILEYIFDCGVGIMLEGNHEWMTDKFNGMDPGAGFPFDFKFNNGLGLTYHF